MSTDAENVRKLWTRAKLQCNSEFRKWRTFKEYLNLVKQKSKLMYVDQDDLVRLLSAIISERRDLARKARDQLLLNWEREYFDLDGPAIKGRGQR